MVMEEKTKRKMCWNCEGNIALEEEICPYCRASIMPTLENQTIAETPAEEEETQTDDTTLVASTLTLLMGGSFFFIFGCLLLFFSENGYFVLRWSSHYWYAYFLIALPMIIVGARNLMRLSDSPQEPIPVEDTQTDTPSTMYQAPSFKRSKKKGKRH
jgi:hypothetical protein